MGTDYDLCIIGGGAAGLVCAAGAAGLGAKVLLVEKHRLGGDCLYTGCVPSKALVHAARQAEVQRRPGPVGVRAVDPQIDLVSTFEYIRSVIGQIEPHDSPERFRALGVEVVFGDGKFADTRSFQIDNRIVTARHFVIATGSRPLVPTIPGLQDVPYLTNESLFELNEAVPKLLVLGGGPIGVEIAQAFARLGSKVSVIDTATEILMREDAELAGIVRQQMEQEGVKFHLGCTATLARRSGTETELDLMDAAGQLVTVKGSHMLIATGRRANTDEIGLDKAGVALVNGAIEVDGRLRTGNKRIFACGDVIGAFPFTHMAEHQAGVVLRNALFHLPARAKTAGIPWCTYTSPEFARVGLSEGEARKMNLNINIDRFALSEVDRARTDGLKQGEIKVLTDSKDKILGAAIVGEHAGELIHEYVLAMDRGLKLSALSSVIHIYPTLAQLNRRVADSHLKKKLTPGTRRWIKRLFRLRGAN